MSSCEEIKRYKRTRTRERYGGEKTRGHQRSLAQAAPPRCAWVPPKTTATRSGPRIEGKTIRVLEFWNVRAGIKPF